ncbi:dipeptide epimerase [Gracilimonas halophila]|uniref:Dipeptide epimerase n=1 Tax=Gracilimonas halophila TaxID=1834464 RepID=A0ABW5JJN8_9BACT
MSGFKIEWEIIPLRLKEVFTISRSSRSQVANVFLSITKDGITGYGEAGPNTRYNETPEMVVSDFESIPSGFFNDIYSLDEVESMISNLNPEPVQSAKTAIEMAWLDWWAKSQNKPLWELLGEKNSTTPVTSFTIGIDSPEKMQAKIRDAEQCPVYKIKLGTDHDREIIEAIREVTDKPLRVDANEGWSTLEKAQEEIQFLSTQNVELIEQPMPSSEFKLMKQLKEWSPLPLAADESFIGNEDLQKIAKAFHVVNIKLMKMGSIMKARRVLNQAHEHGLRVMVGCMIESSLANAAGALVALNAEYADLDGHLLISNDIFNGLELKGSGQLKLSDLPGLGVEK